MVLTSAALSALKDGAVFSSGMFGTSVSDGSSWAPAHVAPGHGGLMFPAPDHDAGQHHHNDAPVGEHGGGGGGHEDNGAGGDNHEDDAEAEHEHDHEDEHEEHEEHEDEHEEHEAEHEDEHEEPEEHEVGEENNEADEVEEGAEAEGAEEEIVEEMDEMPAAVSLMNGLRVCLEQAGDELEKQVNKAAQMRFFPRGLVKSLFSGSSSSTRTSVVGKTGGRGGPSSSSASLNNRRRVDSSRRGGSSSSTRPQLRRRSSTPRGGTTSNYTKEAGNLLQGSGSSTPRTGSTGVRVKRSFLEDQVPQVVLDDDKLILNGKEFIRKEGNNVRRREQHHQFTKRNNRNLGTQQQRTRADTPRPPILTTASRTRRGNPSSGVSSASSQITSSTGSATSSNLVGISPGGVVSPQLVTGTAGVAGTISTLLPLNPSSASIPGLPNPASIPGLRPQHHNATSIPTIVPTSMVPTTMAQPTGVTSSGCGNNLVPAAPHLMLGGKTMTPARVSTTTAARTLGKKLPSLLRSPPQDPGECPTSASTLYSDAMASSRKTEKSSQMQGVALFF